MSITKPQSFTGPSFAGLSYIYTDIPSDVSRIPLEDIKQATNNFAQQNVIQRDEFYDWTVYKWELSGKKFAFISIPGHIDPIDLRVLNELTKHQNIVSLIGICDEDYFHLIIVVEHLTHGGLDKYVSSTAHLTWLMRLQISLDIASALHSLQNHPQRWEMCIGYLSSASIHLDENWQAKIQFIKPWALMSYTPKTLRPGQLGYVDPLYTQTGMISKLTEIYSFGVILFELLCARPAITYDEEGREQFLSKLACSHYEKGTLTKFINPLLREQINRDSFTVFSKIAYRCLSGNRSIHPTISLLIEQVQQVLKLQQGFVTSELQQVSYCQFINVVFLFS